MMEERDMWEHSSFFLNSDNVTSIEMNLNTTLDKKPFCYKNHEKFYLWQRYFQVNKVRCNFGLYLKTNCGKCRDKCYLQKVISSYGEGS